MVKVKDLSAETDVVSHEKADPANVKHVGAPMPGKLFKIMAVVGEKVSAGETLLTTEAMKMETEVLSGIAGKVVAVHVKKGDRVNPGEILVEIA